MNFARQGFRKLSYYAAYIRQTRMQTEGHRKRYHAAWLAA